MGSRVWLELEKVDCDRFRQDWERLEVDGGTVVGVAVDGQCIGLIQAKDSIKKTTKAAIESLKREGMRVMMLTGDQARAAQAVANECQIDEYMAGVMPSDKLDVIRRLQAEGILSPWQVMESTMLLR